MSGYVRGQTLIAAANGIAVGGAIALLGVPLAVPLGVLAFLGGWIPAVGILLAGAAAVLVALAAGGGGTALAVLAIVVGLHEIEVHVLAPAVHSRIVRLHPLAVLIALAVGGLLWGVVGALLAVPTTASAAQTLAHLRRRAATPRTPKTAAASAAGNRSP